MRVTWGKTRETQMVPFDEDGDQRTYADRWEVDHGRLKFVPNTLFADTLTYNGYGRGRSAAYFEFLRSDGTAVTVFMTDMEQMIRKMERGVIKGTFTFCKRGQNYGCRLVEETV